MAGLFRAQQITCATNLQIPHSDFKSGAKLSKIPNGSQSLFSYLREGFIGTVGEIGVCVTGGTANAATELVQLTQTKPVSIFNDEGIHIGNIQAGLNNRCAYQNLNFAVCHRTHYIAKRFLAHFTVGNSHLQAGDTVFQGSGATVYGFHTVVQVVHLPATFYLTANGIVQHSIVVLQHIGLHRVAICRWLFNCGHIPYAG